MPKLDSVNTILNGDCIAGMDALPARSVDLVFADPPFNIGYEYDVYQDNQNREAYLDWSRRWIQAVYRVLTDSGTFWLAIGDDYAAELKLISQAVGFFPRSWVIWYYTFGVNCKLKFTRSHTHLLYFTKNPREFTFRADELENRVPSARQLVYSDSRANQHGRLPDDTWVLRPQDLADCFTPEEDTWYFPRIAGTFRERAGFHGCQMPEQLLGRIIRICSQDRGLVLDPFSGSATTVTVAKKLGRKYLAFDLSSDYVKRGLARLNRVRLGDPLDGAAEPTMSAPATPTAGKGKRLQATKAHSTNPAREQFCAEAIAARRAVEKGLLEAYSRTYDGYSLDRVIADPELNAHLAEACSELGIPGERRDWNCILFRMRKAGSLVDYPTFKRTEFDWDACEDYLFASEIAWRQVAELHDESLDGIFCDPRLAEQFDDIARRWAPGVKPLAYRWAAMKLRKSAKSVRARAETLGDVRFRGKSALTDRCIRQLPEDSGVYVVIAQDKTLYAGQTRNLRHRLATQFSDTTRVEWRRFATSLETKYFVTSCPCTDRLAYQWQIVERRRPLLNRPDLRA